jgi:hypothetical protein
VYFYLAMARVTIKQVANMGCIGGALYYTLDNFDNDSQTARHKDRMIYQHFSSKHDSRQVSHRLTTNLEIVQAGLDIYNARFVN